MIILKAIKNNEAHLAILSILSQGEYGYRRINDNLAVLSSRTEEYYIHPTMFAHYGDMSFPEFPSPTISELPLEA